MVEVAFLPIKMLNPIVEGKGVWWGTSGERILHKNELGPLVLRINPNLYDSREIKGWLKELKPAIIEAAGEVDENICNRSIS